MNAKISVVTAYYNRYDLIDNLINSILEQKYDNYEFILVNDGSNDQIKDKIQAYQNNYGLKVKYFEQVNQGKLTAMNLGTSNATGDLLIGIDSDDHFTNGAFDLIISEYEKVKNDDTIASVYFKNVLIKPNSEKLSVPDFKDTVATHFKQSYINKYSYDSSSFMKINIAKDYPFVVLEGEKFSPEAIVGNRISQKYNSKYVNKVICVREYQFDGLTQNQDKLILENPKGYYVYTSEILANHKLPLKQWIRHSLANGVFAAKTKVGYINNLSNSRKISYKFTQVFAYPLGILYNLIKRS
jgi:glycosyltransferase involved in cell wall biosynthesis